MVIGFVIFTVSRPLGWPILVVNINTIIVSAAVIYMGVLGLKGFSPVAADNAI